MKSRIACPWGRRPAVLSGLALILALAAGQLAPAQTHQDRKQQRAAKTRVEVPPDQVHVGDGDTFEIEWGPGDQETVRILGIDTPEVQYLPHNLPFDQPFGREASGFAKGAFAVAAEIELLRCDTKDPYGRTLAYVFLDGKNYSELIITARLAAESVSQYGDNGFPEEAKRILEAARAAGPVPFEKPGDFRRRMREVSDWMKATQDRAKSTEQR